MESNRVRINPHEENKSVGHESTINAPSLYANDDLKKMESKALLGPPEEKKQEFGYLPPTVRASEYNQVAAQDVQMPPLEEVKENQKFNFSSTYKTPQEYLKELTYEYDAFKDFNLYRIHSVLKDFESEEKEIITGIQLLSPQLQKAYNDKNYLIHIYNGSEHQELIELGIDGVPKHQDVKFQTYMYITAEKPKMLNIIFLSEVSAPTMPEVEQQLKPLKEAKKERSSIFLEEEDINVLAEENLFELYKEDDIEEDKNEEQEDSDADSDRTVGYAAKKRQGENAEDEENDEEESSDEGEERRDLISNKSDDSPDSIKKRSVMEPGSAEGIYVRELSRVGGRFNSVDAKERQYSIIEPPKLENIKKPSEFQIEQYSNSNINPVTLSHINFPGELLSIAIKRKVSDKIFIVDLFFETEVLELYLNSKSKSITVKSIKNLVNANLKHSKNVEQSFTQIRLYSGNKNPQEIDDELEFQVGNLNDMQKFVIDKIIQIKGWKLNDIFKSSYLLRSEDYKWYVLYNTSQSIELYQLNLQEYSEDQSVRMLSLNGVRILYSRFYRTDQLALLIERRIDNAYKLQFLVIKYKESGYQKVFTFESQHEPPRILFGTERNQFFLEFSLGLCYEILDQDCKQIDYSQYQYKLDRIKKEQCPLFFADIALQGNVLYIARGSVISAVDINVPSFQDHFNLYPEVGSVKKMFEYDVQQIIQTERGIVILNKNQECFKLDQKEGKLILKKFQNDFKNIKIVRIVYQVIQRTSFPFIMCEIKSGEESVQNTFFIINRDIQIRKLSMSENSPLLMYDLSKTNLIFKESESNNKHEFYFFTAVNSELELALTQTVYQFQLTIKNSKDKLVNFVKLKSKGIELPQRLMNVADANFVKMINKYFYFVKEQRIDIYDLSTNKMVDSVQVKMRINDMRIFQNFYVYVAGDKVHLEDLLTLLEQEYSETTMIQPENQNALQIQLKYARESKRFITYCLDGSIRIFPALHLNEKELKVRQDFQSKKILGTWLRGQSLYIMRVSIVEEWNVLSGKLIKTYNIDSSDPYQFYFIHQKYNSDEVIGEHFAYQIRIFKFSEELLKEQNVIPFKQVNIDSVGGQILIAEDGSGLFTFNRQQKRLQYYDIFREENSQNDFDEYNAVYVKDYTGIKTIQQISKDGKYLLRENQEVQGTFILECMSKLANIDLTKATKDINAIKQSVKQCLYFISGTVVLFESMDNILIGYDIIQKKEVLHLGLSCRNPKAKFELTYIKYHQQDQTIIFGDQQYTFNIHSGEFSYNYAFRNIQKDALMKKQNVFLKNTLLGSEQKQLFGYYLNDKNVSLVQSFTYYFWKLFLQLKSGQGNEVLDLALWDKNVLREMLMVRLPDGSTLLHCIQFQEDNVRYIFKEFGIKKDSDANKDRMFIPILPDNQGKNVLDYYFEFLNNDRNVKKEKQRVVNILRYVMNKIATYPFDLFHINIEKLVEIFFNHKSFLDIVFFAEFLLKRCKQLNFLSYIEKGDFDHEFKPLITFAQDSLYLYNEEHYRYLFGTEHVKTEPIQVFILDIAGFQNILQQTFYKYQNSVYLKMKKGRSDEIIQNPMIRSIIELKWDYFKIRIIIFVIIPYILFMILFYTYTLYDLETRLSIGDGFQVGLYELKTDFSWNIFGNTIRMMMLILIIYFIFIEYFQMRGLGLRTYWQQGWNNFDWLLYLLVLVSEFLLFYSKLKDLDRSESLAWDRIIRTLYSVASIIMWLKFLYFFRISRGTGYYIRMLIEVFKNIINFMFLFISIVTCFAQALYIFLLNSKHNVVFESMFDSLVYAYFLPFGEFEVQGIFGDFQVWICWVYFFMAQVSLMIVLLNLLIAIVNETFSRINKDYQAYMYKDMISLLQENAFLNARIFACKTLSKQYYRKCCNKLTKIKVLSFLKEREYSPDGRFVVLGVPIKSKKVDELINETTNLLSDQILDLKNDIQQLKNTFTSQYEQIKEIIKQLDKKNLNKKK